MAKVEAKAIGQPVTLRPKRYIFICLGCRLLAESKRRDTLTCSPGCRVRAHRSGSVKKQQAIAELYDVRVSMLGHAAAVNELRPDLAVDILKGTLEMGDAMPMVAAAFDERVRQILKAHR